MNIVVLTCEFHPYMNPVSCCLYQYLLELQNKHHVTVVCPLSAVDFPPFDNQNIEVQYITNWRNTLRAKCNHNIEAKNRRWIWKFILYVLKGYNVFLSTYAFPTRHNWRLYKYKKQLLELSRRIQIDCVISASGWPCTHFAAYFYKKEHQDVKWLTYTLDPFTENPVIYKNILFKKKRYNRNFEAEKLIYDTADYNIFTPELYKSAITIFKQPEYKTVCFPYVLTKFEGCSKRFKAERDNIVAMYAGSLNKKIRNPEIMLSLFSRIPEVKLELYIAGDCNDVVNNFKTDNIIVNSILPREKYIERICSGADILINIGNSNSLQSPSKFLELLSTGLPVINFYYKRDSNFEMTEVYPLGINVNQKGNLKVDEIRSFCNRVRGKRLSFDDVKKLFPKNLLVNQLKQLEEMI